MRPTHYSNQKRQRKGIQRRGKYLHLHLSEIFDGEIVFSGLSACRAQQMRYSQWTWPLGRWLVVLLFS